MPTNTLRYDTYSEAPPAEWDVASIPTSNRLSGSSNDRDGEMLRRSVAGEPGSSSAFMAAFDFLQRNADGRYTDRTLMTINRWALRSDEVMHSHVASTEAMPWVFAIHKEVTYDEDTEVKSGGTIALAVTMPSEWGSKLVMAVHPDARRQGYGTRLMRCATDYVEGLHAWVGGGNVVGQQFLLSVGMRPATMNGRGALLYSYTDMPESDGVAR